MTALRMQGLAAKVYHPKRSKVYSDVIANIEEWENHVTMFKRVENVEMKDTTKKEHGRRNSARGTQKGYRTFGGHLKDI